MFSYALFPSFYRAIKNKSTKRLLAIGGWIVLFQLVIPLVIYSLVNAELYNGICKWATSFVQHIEYSIPFLDVF